MDWEKETDWVQEQDLVMVCWKEKEQVKVRDWVKEKDWVQVRDLVMVYLMEKEQRN